MKSKFKLVLIVFAILFCNTASYVEAASVTFIVEGTLDFVDDELSGTFSIGDLYHLEYTVDSTTIDANPDDPNKSFYENAITSLTVTVGDYYSAVSTGQSLISVYNDDPYDADSYTISIPAESMIGDDVDGCYLYNQGPLLSFGDDVGNAFSDGSLIPYTLDYSNFSGAIGLTFYDPVMSPYIGVVGISANISSFEFHTVPIPSTIFLLSLGLMGLCGMGRIKH